MTKRLFLIAGAALSVGAFAQAQTLDQSRGYSQELLSDASTRTSSLAPAAQDFTPAVHGYEQFRFNWNSRDDSGLDAKNNDQTIGFQNARTRLNVSGNIANENWGYFIQFGWDADGDTVLEDAYGWYKLGNGWSFKWGQFKLPLFREELVGDTYQLFVDRSVTNTRFTQGRSQGVQVSYEGDQFRVSAAFSDGLQTANTDFNSGSEADWALTARGEFKWAGDWKQAKDFTSFQNSEFFGMVGAAIHYQNGGDTVPTTDASDLAATVDVSVEGNGWNAFAAAIYNHFDPSAGTSFSDWAFQIQGGIFVAADWEIVAGWDILVPDSNYGSGQDSNFSTIRVGVNHYIVPESHAAKISVDWSYFLDKQGESALAVPNTLTGLLASAKDSQWNLRGQVQLMF
jgi:hypothetical protein